MITCNPNPDIDLSYLNHTFEYATNDQIQAVVDDILNGVKPKQSHTSRIHKMDLLRDAIARAGHEAVVEWALARRTKVAA